MELTCSTFLPKIAYTYGRSILDVLFTKEELGRSVVMKTKKSEKPPLPPEKIQLLFGKKSSIAYCRSDWFTLNTIVLELQIV